MSQIQIHLKPMSVNEAWCHPGRRYKSKKYKSYTDTVLMMLPHLDIPEGDLGIRIEAGLSKNADLDNICKPILDIIEKKYGCNDNRFLEINLVKKIIKRGEGYFNFCIWGIV